MQLKNSIPLNRKNTRNNCSSTNLLLLNHHLVKKNTNCREPYNVLVYICPHKPNLSTLFWKFVWRARSKLKGHLLLQKVSLDCYVRSFQYKVLNNVLYLNKKLLIFGKSSSRLCSFCKNAYETILHLFYKCDIIKKLWKCLMFKFTVPFTINCLSWIH